MLLKKLDNLCGVKKKHAMLQSQNIRIFRKDNSTFCGSIWRRGGFFEADLISIPDSDRLMARLSHIKPELIIEKRIIFYLTQLNTFLQTTRVILGLLPKP